MTNIDIARLMRISISYVKQLWKQYRLEKRPIIQPGKVGRPRHSLMGRKEESVILGTFYK